MAYDYSNGDGVAVLLANEPDGASEPVSNLDDAVRQIKAYLNDPQAGPSAVTAALVPAGSIQMYGGAAAPAGWLVCNGDTRTDGNDEGAALFAAIGTTYGGTGPTDFKLPNFKGRSPVGAGEAPPLSPRNRGETFGTENHLLTAAQSGLPGHNHTITAGDNGDWDQGTFVHNDGLGPASSFPTIPTTTVGPNNAAEAHNNMQPSLVVNFIIKK
jgi:microcystin-dependent protein